MSTSNLYLSRLALRVPGASNVQELNRLVSHGEGASVGRVAEFANNALLLSTPVLANNPFNISESEFADLDPQAALALSLVHELKLSGAIPRECGVFVGASFQDFTASKDVGATLCMISGRVSYHCGLTGPSVSVDSACTSSLSALEMASLYVGNGVIPSAVVIGVNIIGEQSHRVLTRAGLLSDKHACRPLEGVGGGYQRSEAAVAVFVSREAREGSVQLFGCATGHMGTSNGFGAPRTAGFLSVLRRAWPSEIDKSRLSFVEMSAVGNPIGDELELNALRDFFENEQVACSSSKAILGHAESASGLVALAKVVALRGERPRLLCGDVANGDIAVCMSSGLSGAVGCVVLASTH